MYADLWICLFVGVQIYTRLVINNLFYSVSLAVQPHFVLFSFWDSMSGIFIFYSSLWHERVESQSQWIYWQFHPLPQPLRACQFWFWNKYAGALRVDNDTRSVISTVFGVGCRTLTKNVIRISFTGFELHVLWLCLCICIRFDGIPDGTEIRHTNMRSFAVAACLSNNT